MKYRLAPLIAFVSTKRKILKSDLRRYIFIKDEYLTDLHLFSYYFIYIERLTNIETYFHIYTFEASVA